MTKIFELLLKCTTLDNQMYDILLKKPFTNLL